MKNLIFLLSMLALPAWGSTDLFSALEHEFQAATLPNLSHLESGWHTGRCVTGREPGVEKAGVLVLVVQPDSSGRIELKQVIPAASVRSEPDFFDEIDDEEFQIYENEIYLGVNAPVVERDGSLTSDLYYGILVGTLHTRQSGNNLIVALTHHQESPLERGQTQFICNIMRKVRDL